MAVATSVSAPLEIAIVPRASTPRETEQRLREGVRKILAGVNPVILGSERRREKRYPFPYPAYLTPVGKDGVTSAGDTIVVLGKHLSDLGFDFYHRDPLPYRRAIVSFESARNHWVGVLLDLTWCRFGRHGWYDNGGRFISMVASPLATDLLPSLMD
jgi:hypothetical protein